MHRIPSRIFTKISVEVWNWVTNSAGVTQGGTGVKPSQKTETNSLVEHDASRAHTIPDLSCPVVVVNIIATIGDNLRVIVGIDCLVQSVRWDVGDYLYQFGIISQRGRYYCLVA